MSATITPGGLPHYPSVCLFALCRLNCWTYGPEIWHTHLGPSYLTRVWRSRSQGQKCKNPSFQPSIRKGSPRSRSQGSRSGSQRSRSKVNVVGQDQRSQGSGSKVICHRHRVKVKLFTFLHSSFLHLHVHVHYHAEECRCPFKAMDDSGSQKSFLS